MNRKTAIKQLKELKRDSNKMRLAAEKWDKPWKTLIATILSARTRDETTIKICDRLFNRYDSLNKLSIANLKEIEKIIRSVNFYKNKSKNISKCAKILIEKYKGRTPHTFQNLIELPGVGRKTANVFLSEYGKEAIGIDTHVSYISQKLKWTAHKDSKKIEEDLKKIFPKKYWSKINPILVRFGKTHISRKRKDRVLESIQKV